MPPDSNELHPQAGVPPEHIPYRVDPPVTRDELVHGGRFQKVVEVHFTGPHGIHDSITLPVDQAHPAEVDRRIQERLDHLIEIHKLGPQPHPENLAP